MPQIFNFSSNSYTKVGIIVGLFTLTGVGGALFQLGADSSYATNQGVARVQPVQFSHSHHVSSMGIDCRYCHTSVENAAYANVPPTKTCMNCHSQIWTGSPELEMVRASYRNDTSIPWVKVHDLPDFVYFNHSIHIAKGVGCSTCHGQIDNMPAVYQENTLQMEWCIACHRAPEKFIRPKSEIFNMDWQDGDLNAAERDKLKVDLKIRSKEMMTSCSTCHR